jgi:hypothetical protein
VLCFLDDCQSDWVWWNLNIGFFFFLVVKAFYWEAWTWEGVKKALKRTERSRVHSRAGLPGLASWNS